MTTLASPPATSASRTARGLRLRGLTWLIWRQHRATFWTLIAATAVGVGWIAIQRGSMIDYLNGYGWPHPKTDAWTQGFDPYSHWLTQIGYAIAFLPILLGVFVGAPLLAGDLETGTAKLVTSQSVSRVRWLTAKLTMSVCVVAVCTVGIALASTWWYQPVWKTSEVSWIDMSVFNATGPVPTALTLFTVVAGVAIGMLLRRVLMAMVVTFGFGVVVQIAWGYLTDALSNVATITTHNGVTGPTPDLPPGSIGTDQSFLTSSGSTIGWSTCSDTQTEKAHAACLASNHVVGWSVKYLPFSQMSPMQWTGAAILLVLTAAIVVFILLRGRNRLI
jgi:ABC-type transport system involved in multi-copper enzyme maturation permease subunit